MLRVALEELKQVKKALANANKEPLKTAPSPTDLGTASTAMPAQQKPGTGNKSQADAAEQVQSPSIPASKLVAAPTPKEKPTSSGQVVPRATSPQGSSANTGPEKRATSTPEEPNPKKLRLALEDEDEAGVKPALSDTREPCVGGVACA